ncbi:prepilin peptidase [Herbaspirillum sp. RV1423]|uniref:prepilin peptidase n=1 Tax=Herbaspirillum sp. RV1423 TaxID=1443993 RepID=UPI0004B3B057|nr:prepilin peptidase [Herbaspirillum sp. RV1423]
MASAVAMVTVVTVASITLLGWIAWCDWSRRHIPNALVGLLALLAVTNGCLSGVAPGWPVALAILGAGSLLFALKVCGAGDVKLLAATSLFFPGKGLDLLLGAALSGGCLALVYSALAVCKKRSDPNLPYGVAIVAAALVEIFAS